MAAYGGREGGSPAGAAGPRDRGRGTATVTGRRGRGVARPWPVAWRGPASFLLALTLAAALGLGAARLPVPWLLMEPGVALPVPVRVTRPAGGAHLVETSFWLVTVAARPARLGDAWLAWRDPRRALVARAALGGETLDQVVAAQRAALAASKAAAGQAAAKLLEIRPAPSVDFVLPSDVAGPSGGLALGLAAVDALAPGDLAGGLRVAATGTLTPQGAVGPVEGVELKRLAAAEEGLDVLFVPAAAPGGGAGGAGPMVVRVTSLAEAVRWLCAHGGRGAPCP
ncbi:S16 family serine protease [Thermaerobacter litoralis]